MITCLFLFLMAWFMVPKSERAAPFQPSARGLRVVYWTGVFAATAWTCIICYYMRIFHMI